MRQEVFRPLPVHLGALDETLTWCGEAAEAADTRVDIELTVQDGTLHIVSTPDFRRAGRGTERRQHNQWSTDQRLGRLL